MLPDQKQCGTSHDVSCINNRECVQKCADKYRGYLRLAEYGLNQPHTVLIPNKDAVKQAVKNLLLTNHYEKPFKPYFGGNLNDILFELANDETSSVLREDVINAIHNYEERAQVLEVIVNDNIDFNEIKVKVIFRIKNLNEVVEVETTLSRLR